MKDVLLEVKKLSKIVAGSPPIEILAEASLSVAAGESVAILGRSGSGKTTLLSIMAGLDLPTSGSVSLSGQSLFALNEDQRARHRARHIGFVFQSFQLLPSLTALENVLLPLEINGLPDARARALEALDQVGLSDRLGHYPKYLSGGEQQRVAIARAWVVRPALLFADEPTGNLDAVTGERIMDLLFDLQRQYQTALVLVTHDQALAGRCARRVLLQAGRLENLP